MKAVRWTKYGSPDGLQVREVEKPAPKDDEVLIKVYSVGVTAADTEMRRLKLSLYAIPLRIYLGINKPARITTLGTDFAGEIEAVGNRVSRYKLADQLFGYTGLKMGAYAEYICLAEKPSAIGCVMAKKSTNMTYEEAAAIPIGGLEALHSLKQAEIRHGQKVVIVGAGGSIGTCAVQLAKYYGAEVTAVDKAGKLEMLRSIGAEHVIDFREKDFTKSGERYDVIFDTVGKSSFSRGLRVLNETGTYLIANPGVLGRMRMRWSSRRSNKRVIPWEAGYTERNLLALKELAEAGAIRAVIDRRYRLEDIAEAHRYVDSGEKKGNVVVVVNR